MTDEELEDYIKFKRREYAALDKNPKTDVIPVVPHRKQYAELTVKRHVRPKMLS